MPAGAQGQFPCGEKRLPFLLTRPSTHVAVRLGKPGRQPARLWCRCRANTLFLAACVAFLWLWGDCWHPTLFWWGTTLGPGDERDRSRGANRGPGASTPRGRCKQNQSFVSRVELRHSAPARSSAVDQLIGCPLQCRQVKDAAGREGATPKAAQPGAQRPGMAFWGSQMSLISTHAFPWIAGRMT